MFGFNLFYRTLVFFRFYFFYFFFKKINMIPNTVETADRDSMLNRIVWANRIVHFRARLYHCGDPLYKIGR